MDFRKINFGLSDAQSEGMDYPDLLIDGYVNILQVIENVNIPRIFLFLGYKGSGKSSLSEHLRLSESDSIIEQQPLKDFPFKLFEKVLDGDDRTIKYKTIWRWLLCAKVLSSLCQDSEALIPNIKEALAVFTQAGLFPVFSISSLLKKSTATTVSATIDSLGISHTINAEYADTDLEMLIDYIKYLADKDIEKTSRKVSMYTLIYHLQHYDKMGIRLRQVDKKYILGFVEYLKTATQKHCKSVKNISANTQVHYYKVFHHCLNSAVIDEIITSNPMDKIKNEEKPKRRRTERAFLTIDELKILSQTDFHNATLKKAFLFSCFCGLRHSDIVALTWGNLKKGKVGKMELHMTQQKTQEILSLPLSKEALKQLPVRGKVPDTEKVFKGLISL